MSYLKKLTKEEEFRIATDEKFTTDARGWGYVVCYVDVFLCWF